MTQDQIANIIQSLAIIVSLGAALTALVIASKDRDHARKIAEQDRRSNLRQARLMFEWEAASRLSINLARGGHTDPDIRKDMGSEALALVALLGPERVPHLWARKVGKTDAELRAFIENEGEPQFLRDAVEAERAVESIAREIRAEPDA